MKGDYEKLKQALQQHNLSFLEHKGEISLQQQPETLYATLQLLKEQLGFDYLVDVGTLDYYTDQGRFEVHYNLYNLAENVRVRVKCRLEEEKPEVESVVPLWPSANWYEREAYDMMGIVFRNHPDPRRIYMPEDFQFFPLRKEFPLIGIPGSIQLPEKEGPKGYR